MRLSIIWTIPAMSLRERVARTGDWAIISLAHRLPRRLAYRSYIDTTARYSTTNPTEVVPDIRALDVIGSFERPGVRV